MKTMILPLLLLGVLTATQAHAASSGTLALQGTVSLVNTIAVNQVSPYNALDIVNGQSNTTVANVDETSNDLLGYHITMASLNAGQLQNASDTSKKTLYTISYDGAAAVAPTLVAQSVKNVASLAGLTTNNSLVKINVTAYATAPAGVYSDTITFAILAN